MLGRSQIDIFQQLLPRLKRSIMYKLPEVLQQGSTNYTASGYGTNITKQKTKYCDGSRTNSSTKFRPNPSITFSDIELYIILVRSLNDQESLEKFSDPDMDP